MSDLAAVPPPRPQGPRQTPNVNTIAICRKLPPLYHMELFSVRRAVIIDKGPCRNSDGELAERKECKIEEGHLMPDHVHMLISIPPKYSVAEAFASFSQQRVAAVLVGSSTFYNRHMEQLATLAARHSLPAIFPYRENVARWRRQQAGRSRADGSSICYRTINTGTLPSARTSDVWLPNHSFLMPRRP